MKLKETCAHCGKNKKVKFEVESTDEHRDQFFKFIDIAQRNKVEGIIPELRYGKGLAVIPAPGQSPCQLCKHGHENIGPTGCGRGQICYAYQYYKMFQLDKASEKDTLSTLREFACGVPNASWLYPLKKKEAARSAVLPFDLTPSTSSAKEASPQKSVSRSSKWQKSSKPRSTRAKTRSRKRG